MAIVKTSTKIKTLYVNGCSWTEGFFLHTDPAVKKDLAADGWEFRQNFLGQPVIVKDGIEPKYPYRDILNNYAWCGHVARAYNIPTVVNESAGGGSNARLYRQTLNYIRSLKPSEYKNTLVVIGWTIPERSEIFLRDEYYDATSFDESKLSEAWSRFNLTEKFSLIEGQFSDKKTKQIDKFWEQYVATIHTYEQSLSNYFQMIYSLKHVLQSKRIPYYFFNVFPLWGMYRLPDSQLEYYSDWLASYKEEIENHAMSYDTTFFDLIEDSKEKDGLDVMLPDRHPNALGHKMWADVMLKDMQAKKYYEQTLDLRMQF